MAELGVTDETKCRWWPGCLDDAHVSAQGSRSHLVGCRRLGRTTCYRDYDCALATVGVGMVPLASEKIHLVEALVVVIPNASLDT